MTEPELRPRRGSHRERRGLLVSVLPAVVAVSAVAALVGGVAVWRGDDEPDDVTTAVGSGASPAPGAIASAGAPGASPSVAPAPAPSAATTAPATTPPATTAPATTAPATTPPATTAPATTAPATTAPATTAPATTAPATTAPATTAPATPAATTANPTPTPSPSGSTTALPTDPPAANGGGLLTPPAVVVLNQTRIKGLAARMAADLRDEGWEVAATGNFRGTVASTTVYYPPGLAAAAEDLTADIPGSQRIRPRFGNLSTTRLTVVLTSP